MGWLRSGRRGLTIGELVVAIGLLATALVTVMVLFGQILEVTTKNSMVSQDSFVADQLLEEETAYLRRARRASNNPMLDHTPPAQKITLRFRAEEENVEYLYRVGAYTVDGQNYSDQLGQVFRIELDVRWWQETGVAEKTRSGYGRTSLQRMKIVYAQKKTGS